MPLKNLTILYVEDNIDAQEQLKMILEDDVKEFYQAYDGEEGLTLYREKKPDIILADINMPLLDGLEMAKQIKKIDPEQPILIISSFDDKETLLKAINIVIDGFIQKPIDIDMLETQLNKIAKNLHQRKSHQNTREEEINKLYNLAHYDMLTKIPNRVLFDIRLKQAISNATRHNTNVALFFIDLDDFKNINDYYGHQAGDKILISIVNNIKKVIRSEDTLSRIGGDEFALIIEGVVEKSYVTSLAEKIVEASSVCIKQRNNEIYASCSLGISIFPDDTNDKKELIHFADVAMYKSKSSGKKNFSYYTKEI